MNNNYPMDRILILVFVFLFLFFFIISKYRKDNIKDNKYKNQVRASYGDEFYNYRGEGSTDKEILNDNIEELVYEVQTIEGFSGTNVTESTIVREHSKCPVKEGETKYTTCIHYPNRVINGLDHVSDYGFIVSVSCRSCLDSIQRSLDNNGEYDIIFENNNYSLTKNGVKKQTLLECNSRNILRVQELVGTVNIN